MSAGVPLPANAPTWHGKRLHVWVTTCDARGREFQALRAAIDAHPTLVDSVGISCQTLLNDGGFVTVGEGTRGKGDRAALAAQLHARRVATTLLVANPATVGFDGQLGKRVLENDGTRRRLVDYDGPGGRHEVWFDDAESMQRVLEDLRPIATEVRRVAIWGMSGADPALMAMLERMGFRRSAE